MIAAALGEAARVEVLTSADGERWAAYVPARRCVMGTVEYARLCELQTGYGARLFVAGRGGAAVAYPHLLRPVSQLDLAAASAFERYDTCTPEYTGPLSVGDAPVDPGTAALFAEAFSSYCREQHIVAEFAHLNPWTTATEVLEPGSLEANREIVYVDLTWGEERIWNHSFSSDARRMTRQAQKAGVVVRHAGSERDVAEFHRLYMLTMQRLNALGRYLLPLDYFLALFRTMPETSFIALVEHGGRAVAGGMYLHGGDDVYWHLSAMDEEFARVRPVNAMVHDSIRWAIRAGKKRMLFGGGYRRDDGVFRFKAGFSPLRAAFKTYRFVRDPEAYATLLRAWSARNGGAAPRVDYFPAYRHPGP